MKKIPRAEISTIKGMLYPEKKSSLKEWNKKNLKNIKELEEKNKKLKEEKKISFYLSHIKLKDTKIFLQD